MEDRFGFVQRAWFVHPQLDAARIAVLSAFSTYADREGWCWPSQDTLARDLKKSRPWVTGIITALLECDPPVLERQGRAYRLIGHEALLAALSANRQPADPNTRTPASQTLSRGQPQVVQDPEPVPPGWLPDSSDLAFAAKHRPDVLPDRLAKMTRVFATTARPGAVGPNRAWRRWVMREEWRPARPATPSGGQTLIDRNAARAQDALGRIMARRGSPPAP